MPPTDPIKTNLDPVFTGQKPASEAVPTSAYNVLSNQQYVPSQTPAPSPRPTTDFSPDKKSIIRTYKGDLESAIASNHLSSINIAIAENQKMYNEIQGGEKETGPQEKSPDEGGEYSKNKIIIFISLVLILAGIIALAVVYFTKNQSPGLRVLVQKLPSLITTEYKEEVSIETIAKNSLADILATKFNNTQVPEDNFYNIYLTTGTSSAKKLISSSDFVSLMKFQMPDMAKRTLLPDFMVGMYSFGRNLPFVILKTSSFENAYAGMLAWEKDLEKDFKVLFRLTGYEKQESLLDTLTPATSTKEFADGVIVNKDVRLLRETDGQVQLLYGIIDKETIVITVSDTAFKEIINRLNKEKTLKR